MYVNVRVSYDLGEKLAVPEEAVMRTGTRDIVFVADPNGHFTPKTVKLGAKAQGYYEVLGRPCGRRGGGYFRQFPYGFGIEAQCSAESDGGREGCKLINRGGALMIDKIIEFSAHNKFIIIFFTLVAIVGAVYCIQNMPLDAIPDLSDTQVIIYSRWDRSPDIMEASGNVSDCYRTAGRAECQGDTGIFGFWVFVCLCDF